ncbi:unnamed protein product [Pylaiella littoralis]
MLRTVSRSIYQSARSGRPSNSRASTAAAVAPFILKTSGATQPTLVGPSVRRWGSWTSRAASAGQQQRPTQSQLQFPLSPSAMLVLVRSKSSVASSPAQWEDEGLPVVPVLSDVSQQLPSNLTLAEEAWPEEEEEEESEIFSEDGDEAGPLSEEDENMIASILDIPAFVGADSLDVGVVCWADGSSAGSISLTPSVFGVPVRRDVVHDVVRWQLARRRKGNGQTKRIAEVSGSGRKVRPQKGGGVARAGHSRPPHWRGGAKAHGPRRRDFSFKLNKKFVKLGLRVALSARLQEGHLTVVDELESDTFSTSVMRQRIEARELDGGVTFVVGGNAQKEFLRSTTNIVGVKVLPARGANVYDIIKRPNLVLTKDAVTELEGNLETS